MTRLLVTGGCGFIGSNFIHYIRKEYPTYHIINLDLLSYAGVRDSVRLYEGSAGYEFVQGNITDVSLVESLASRVDAIVHFAAETHVDRSIIDSTNFVQTNVVGTQILLDAARRHKLRFHHISTDEVFGSLTDNSPLFNEKTPYDPRSPYSASKAASDHIVRSYVHTHDLFATITNCSNNYGPYQYPEKLHSLFITNLLEGRKLPIYGEGLQIRDWLFVDDHCRAIDLVLHRGKKGETYCVGGGVEKRNIDIARSLLKLTGLDEEYIEFVPDRKGHDFRYAVDFSKISQELGWYPEVSFDEGMQRTFDWYKDNIAWWKKLKDKSFV
ncbi:MAG: dTDP-glucose 4,6-dehydratase [Candidatus Paceibacterota bacterium]